MNTSDFGSLPWVDIPLALAALHRELPVGASAIVRFPPAEALVGFPRAGESTPAVAGLLEGAGFAPPDGPVTHGLEWVLQRLRTLPDVVGPGMRALVCGLNPSLRSADVGFGYAGATNRFWNAALAAQLVQVARQPLESFRLDAVGMTDVVKRPTARSHHLDPAEYHLGMARLERMVAWLKPAVVIFVGLEGWRAANNRKAQPGWQAVGVGGQPAYVMPSTSGANARTPLPALVTHLRAALAGPG